MGAQEEMHHVFSQLGIRRYQVGDWEGIARIVLNKSGNQIRQNGIKFMETHIYTISFVLFINDGKMIR